MQVTPPTDQKSQSSQSMATKTLKKHFWWQTWQFWGILLVICSGGIGYGATSMLLNLPQTQSCNKVLWPVASASVRLYCAQNLAEEKNVESLLKAIALVEKLAPNHPLRNEIDRNVEKWTTAILTIGETKFQEGNLEAAIAIANQIPPDVAASAVIKSQIEDWNATWLEAAGYYEKVENSLRNAQWSDAFSWAVRLTDSKNDYWATTKYSEAIDNINVAQEETVTLNQASNQLKDGNIDSLLDAIAKAVIIPEDSYTYENAQNIITEGKAKLLVEMNRLILQKEWSKLQKASYRIPDALGLEEEVKDWRILGNAGSSALSDTVFGLEDAIAEVAKIEPTSPLYSQAQQLSDRWTREIDDVQHITRAKELARKGNISAYNAAILEIGLIPPNNPRYSEAREKIAQWRGEIQIIEDRPIIQRAKELALGNNTTAWRRAIAEINLVSSSSPLYAEAQKNARTWQSSIEREEDQPILDQAISFGNIGEYEQAIAIAQPIAQGRALSSQAQDKITQWRGEIQANNYLEEARYLAEQNNSDSLAKAIRTIRQIPPSSMIYYEVVPNVNDWSGRILDLAQKASYRSLKDAIAIAEKVPSGTAAHGAAQVQLERWNNRLNPQPQIQKEEKSKGGLQLEKNKKN